MGSPLLGQLAGGVQPVAQPDVTQQILKNIGSQIANKQAQAGVGLTLAQTQEAKAAAEQTGETTKGIQAENVLKQRNADAQTTLGKLFQSNTTKNPDGSQSTDMASVLAQYRAAGYADYALKLQEQIAQTQQKQTEAAKNQFDLNAAKLKAYGYAGAQLGLDDPKLDPKKATQLYQQFKQIADQQGFGDMVTATPQQFASNPGTYLASVASNVNASGQKAEVLQNQKAQLEAKQQAQTVMRNEYDQMMQGVSNPTQYQQVLGALTQKYGPEVVASAHLPPASAMTTPQALGDAKQAATISAIQDPKARQEAINAVQTTHSEIALRNAQAGAQRAEAGLAGAQTGLAQAQTATTLGTYGETFGKNPLSGQPVSQTGTTGNIPTSINLSNGKSMDLKSIPAWNGESDGVKQAALNVVNGNSTVNGADPKDPLARRVASLAASIDPNYKNNVEARSKLQQDSQPYVTAANAAIHHSVPLVEYAKQLNQTNPQFLNTKIGNIKSQFGSEVQAEFENRLNRYNGEIEKMQHGGVPTISGLNEGLQTGASQNKTVGQLLGIVRDNNDLIQQKGEVINNQYNKQLKGNILGGGIDVLQPESRDIIAKQGVNGGKSASVTVKLPGQQPAPIKRSRLQDFLRDHPGATVIKQ